MATRRYGLSKGEQYTDVLEEVGAATVNNSMEFTFDLAQSLTREDVILALDMIRQHILADDFPPA